MLARIQAYLWVGIGVAALYTGWIFLSRRASVRTAPARTDSRAAEFDRIYGGTDVKILQFYAEDASLVEGQKSLICYGVLNAKSVRMEPPVEGLMPAVNRCVRVAPMRNTRYTLFAEGNDGRMVSESFVLGVHADQETLPKVTEFKIVDRKPDYRGKLVFLLSFSQRNGEEVSIEPAAFPTLHGSPNGRFYVAPEKTTTYTLTVKGKFGHQVQQQLTLEVPKG